MKILLLGKQPVFGKLPFLHPHYCIFGKKFEKRNFFIAAKLRFHIWNDAYMHKLSLAQLRFRIEDPYAIDLIAEQFNSVRLFVSERVDIENSSPDRKLARLINKIRPFKSITHKPSDHFVDIYHVRGLNVNDIAGKCFWQHYFLE